MPTLVESQVGFATRVGITRDVAPTVDCPYCDKPLNPLGNIGTHTVQHPKGNEIAFYRTHVTCAREALPCETVALDQQALALLEHSHEQARGAALIRKH
jgi:hypothetical protein